MTDHPRRRAVLGLACVCGAGWSASLAQTGEWAPPARLQRPDVAGDEGGLWALMDREETRLRRSPFLLREGGLREYITGIVCKLGGEHCADVRVYPVRTPWFNATMAPNGMMQVWSGLLLRVDNEAQLAAVLGHEIGHYLQRHSLQRLRDAKSRSAAMGVLAFAGGIGLIGQMALLAGASAYSREHETEADRIGVILMRKAGYDAREAANIWENLRAELSAGAGGDPANKSVLFATHPRTDERQAALRDSAGAEGGELGEQAYGARIAPFMPELIDDELRRTQYDETIVLMTRLSERRPRRGDLVYARGEARRLRAGAQDAEAAHADFVRALELEAPPPQTHRALGLMHKEAGRKSEAAQSFRAYLHAAPTAPDSALIESYITELTS